MIVRAQSLKKNLWVWHTQGISADWGFDRNLEEVRDDIVAFCVLPHGDDFALESRNLLLQGLDRLAFAVCSARIKVVVHSRILLTKRLDLCVQFTNLCGLGLKQSVVLVEDLLIFRVPLQPRCHVCHNLPDDHVEQSLNQPARLSVQHHKWTDSFINDASVVPEREGGGRDAHLCVGLPLLEHFRFEARNLFITLVRLCRPAGHR
jgi:hypothetical protein